VLVKKAVSWGLTRHWVQT